MCVCIPTVRLPFATSRQRQVKMTANKQVTAKFVTGIMNVEPRALGVFQSFSLAFKSYCTLLYKSQ